jgi:hypothetical protein
MEPLRDAERICVAHEKSAGRMNTRDPRRNGASRVTAHFTALGERHTSWCVLSYIETVPVDRDFASRTPFQRSG